MLCLSRYVGQTKSAMAAADDGGAGSSSFDYDEVKSLIDGVRISSYRIDSMRCDSLRPTDQFSFRACVCRLSVAGAY